MKFERIDDKTVKCYISMEEMQEYDITYKDFIIRSEKAKEIVEEIILRATEEVGYRPPQFALDLQIMMMPEQGMVLTFSEKMPEELPKKAANDRPDYAVFSFATMRDICDFANHLPRNLRVKSCLYKERESFYLYMEKGGASYERYSRACIMALEYGSLYGADIETLVYLDEHATCLIAEKAIQKLRL